MNAVQRWLLCAALALTGAAHATYPDRPIKVSCRFRRAASISSRGSSAARRRRSSASPS